MSVFDALLAGAFVTEAFAPYVVGRLGTALWHRVYFKGRSSSMR